MFDDFSHAVPAPDYIRRDGVLNLASHFPKNAVAPDIGPKMYNAQASRGESGGSGSTRLHMDMADAINVMIHAENQPDGSLGGAVWNLFHAEDADKLREFMLEEIPSCSLPGDPIHSQEYYLTADLLRRLYDKHRVKCHRIVQRVGEAVLIPAGCAHQVCTLHSFKRYYSAMRRFVICPTASKSRSTLSAPKISTGVNS